MNREEQLQAEIDDLRQRLNKMAEELLNKSYKLKDANLKIERLETFIASHNLSHLAFIPGEIQ